MTTPSRRPSLNTPWGEEDLDWLVYIFVWGSQREGSTWIYEPIVRSMFCRMGVCPCVSGERFCCAPVVRKTSAEAGT